MSLISQGWSRRGETWQIAHVCYWCINNTSNHSHSLLLLVHAQSSLGLHITCFMISQSIFQFELFCILFCFRRRRGVMWSFVSLILICTRSTWETYTRIHGNLSWWRWVQKCHSQLHTTNLYWLVRNHVHDNTTSISRGVNCIYISWCQRPC